MKGQSSKTRGKGGTSPKRSTPIKATSTREQAKQEASEALRDSTLFAGSPIKARRQIRSLAPLCVGIISAVSAVVLAILGISPLPVWALALITADIALWSAAITFVFSVERHGTDDQAKIRQQESRIRALAAGNFLLGVLLVGIWGYTAWFPTFVNVVPNKGVTMSPEAGAPPRQSYDAPVLVGGEEQSAYCYVVVRGETWLNFHNGWAPLSAFHYPAGIPARLPPPCG